MPTSSAVIKCAMRENRNASLSALIRTSSAKPAEEQTTSGGQHLSCQWQARTERNKYLHLRETFSFAGEQSKRSQRHERRSNPVGILTVSRQRFALLPQFAAATQRAILRSVGSCQRRICVYYLGSF